VRTKYESLYCDNHTALPTCSHIVVANRRTLEGNQGTTQSHTEEKTIMDTNTAMAFQEGLTFKTIPLRREGRHLSLMQCLEARQHKYGFVDTANLPTKFAQAFENRDRIKVCFMTRYGQPDKVFEIHSGTVILTQGPHPRFLLEPTGMVRRDKKFLLREQDIIIEV
jgi:hypothetical protein